MRGWENIFWKSMITVGAIIVASVVFLLDILDSHICSLICIRAWHPWNSWR